MGYDLQKFDTFAPNLLGLFGVDVLLPDASTIRAVFPGRQEAVVNDYSNITYREYVLRIPPDGLGNLPQLLESDDPADHVVTIEDSEGTPRTYYVANVAPADLGWWVATLQDHSERSPGNGAPWQSP